MLSNTPAQRFAAYLAGLIDALIVVVSFALVETTADRRWLALIVLPVLWFAYEVSRFVYGRRNERAHRAWQTLWERGGAR